MYDTRASVIDIIQCRNIDAKEKHNLDSVSGACEAWDPTSDKRILLIQVNQTKASVIKWKRLKNPKNNPYWI